jgi:hypothetical protein
MISPSPRNDTVEIVVPYSKYRQCAAVKKSKIYASVANRSHLSMDQGWREAAFQATGLLVSAFEEFFIELSCKCE